MRRRLQLLKHRIMAIIASATTVKQSLDGKASKVTRNADGAKGRTSSTVTNVSKSKIRKEQQCRRLSRQFAKGVFVLHADGLSLISASTMLVVQIAEVATLITVKTARTATAEWRDRRWSFRCDSSSQHRRSITIEIAISVASLGASV